MQWGRREADRMDEAEALDDDEPSHDKIVLEALITEPDPLWWDCDLAPWDLLYPVIPF